MGDELRPGMHVDLIGAFRPEMCEADGAAFARSRVFVDTRAGAMDEAGDLLQAIAGGHFRAEDIQSDLTALSQGRHIGRGGDRDAITLFKSVGAALEDLAAAELVMERWRQQ
jgi:ornithine cyclodeaminase/alanine dehydrogenase-like protein (mu-crystallin family)